MLDINPLSFTSSANIFSQYVVILYLLSQVHGVFDCVCDSTYLPILLSVGLWMVPSYWPSKQRSFRHLRAQLVSTGVCFSEVSLGNLGVELMACGPPPCR